MHRSIFACVASYGAVIAVTITNGTVPSARDISISPTFFGPSKRSSSPSVERNSSEWTSIHFRQGGR